jgi:hypothetical protein
MSDQEMQRYIPFRLAFLIRHRLSRRRAPLSLRLLPQPRALPAALSLSHSLAPRLPPVVFIRIRLSRSYFGFDKFKTQFAAFVCVSFASLSASSGQQSAKRAAVFSFSGSSPFGRNCRPPRLSSLLRLLWRFRVPRCRRQSRFRLLLRLRTATLQNYKPSYYASYRHPTW